MTFIHEHDLYSLDGMCKMNFLCQGFRKLSYYILRIHAFSSRRGHFPSHDKDGSHTTESATTENPMLHANLMALFFIEPELWAIKVYIAGIGILDVFGSCDLDLDPMTFIYEHDLYCLEIYWMCKYELPTSMFSKVIIWQTDRQTYIHTYRQTESTEITNNAASWMVNYSNDIM